MTDEPTYPQKWAVEAVRNPAGRAWYFVSRFVRRTEVEYVLEGFSNEPARFRIRREAQEVADRLNAKGAGSPVRQHHIKVKP